MSSNQISMFVDETGTNEESKILAIACVVSNATQYLRNSLKQLQKELSKNVRLQDIPSIKNLERKGFHYCEDHPDVRGQVLDLIAKLPFEAYVYYMYKKEDFSPSNGFRWYDKLFEKLMRDRLCRHKKSSITIYFEQHSSSVNTRREELDNILQIIIKSMGIQELANAADSPNLLSLKSAGKEELCLSIADYVAGVFKDYEEERIKQEKLEQKRTSMSWQARHFRMLTPKIRVIHNYDSEIFYTRNNPFPGYNCYK